MRLSRQGVEFLRLQLTTAPVVTGTWEASFDSGTTWVTGVTDTVDTTVTEWLVAGPSAIAPDATATVLTATTYPLVRLRHAPEVVVRSLAPITLF